MAQSEAGEEKERLISSWICPKAGGLRRVREWDGLASEQHAMMTWGKDGSGEEGNKDSVLSP